MSTKAWRRGLAAVVAVFAVCCYVWWSGVGEGAPAPSAPLSTDRQESQVIPANADLGPEGEAVTRERVLVTPTPTPHYPENWAITVSAEMAGGGTVVGAVVRLRLPGNENSQEWKHSQVLGSDGEARFTGLPEADGWRYVAQVVGSKLRSRETPVTVGAHTQLVCTFCRSCHVIMRGVSHQEASVLFVFEWRNGGWEGVERCVVSNNEVDIDVQPAVRTAVMGLSGGRTSELVEVQGAAELVVNIENEVVQCVRQMRDGVRVENCALLLWGQRLAAPEDDACGSVPQELFHHVYAEVRGLMVMPERVSMRRGEMAVTLPDIVNDIGSMSMQVVSHDGEGVGGVHVGSAVGHQIGQAPLRTDNGGRVRMPTYPGAVHAPVAVVHSDYCPVAVQPVDGLVIPLAKGAEKSFHVQHALGVVVGNVVVDFTKNVGAHVVRITRPCDADGRLRCVVGEDWRWQGRCISGAGKTAVLSTAGHVHVGELMIESIATEIEICDEAGVSCRGEYVITGGGARAVVTDGRGVISLPSGVSRLTVMDAGETQCGVADVVGGVPARIQVRSAGRLIVRLRGLEVADGVSLRVEYRVSEVGDWRSVEYEQEGLGAIAISVPCGRVEVRVSGDDCGGTTGWLNVESGERSADLVLQRWAEVLLRLGGISIDGDVVVDLFRWGEDTRLQEDVRHYGQIRARAVNGAVRIERVRPGYYNVALLHAQASGGKVEYVVAMRERIWFVGGKEVSVPMAAMFGGMVDLTPLAVDASEGLAVVPEYGGEWMAAVPWMRVQVGSDGRLAALLWDAGFDARSRKGRMLKRFSVINGRVEGGQ